jgi:diguanylate cyclase (GGDEF)-like protein
VAKVFWPTIHFQPVWLIHALLLGAIAMVAWGISRRHALAWRERVSSLTIVAGQARAGDVPLDDLNPFAQDRDLAPLASLVQSMLRDLRDQRRAMAVIEAEMNTRVINRTDALQRSIAGLRSQASRDALTGLFNRRMLDENLPGLIEQCHTEDLPLSALMIDVDHFKNLNDTLGHASGDEALKSIGQIIRSAVRDGDLAYRLGGDEFAILLPGSDRSAGVKLAQRLETLVDSLAKTMRVNPRPRLSIGIATLSELNDRTAEALMRQADAAAYAIKAARKARQEFDSNNRRLLPSAAR